MHINNSVQVSTRQVFRKESRDSLKYPTTECFQYSIPVANLNPRKAVLRASRTGGG